MTLKELSQVLTKIHLKLLDAEKAQIGQMLQRAPTPYDLLNLFSNDPRFAWLKDLTQLIAYIDEVTDGEESSQIREQIKQRLEKVLLSQDIAATSTATLGKKYFELKNINPELVDLHVQLMRFMNESIRGPSDILN